MRREARLLKLKAVASLRRAAQAFNSLEDSGRVTTVLLHSQHAFEMLLKATLVERGQRVFDPQSGRSIGFSRALNLARQELRLSEEVAGTLRALNAMRDDEQHYLGGSDEALLYLHLRAGVTIFEDVLRDVFGESLADILPTRVLPISTEPPADLDLLINRQFRQIGDLLEPGRRQRPEARRMIRTLLALEGHVAEDAEVSERDVNRVERGIRDGKSRDEVFPRLRGLGSETHGSGLTVRVRITRQPTAPPVRFVGAEEPIEAAAIREVDLRHTFKHSPRDLAQKLRIDTGKSKALRWHLAIEDDPACRYVFTHGKMTFPMYSDVALERMRTAIADGADLPEIRARYRDISGGSRP
jgi:HEPN domain-containing protein